MKNTNRTTKRRSPARWSRDSRFAVATSPAVNFRATEPTEFEQLKDRLLKEQLMTETRAEFLTLLRQAANEAAAVAWAAPYPLLVLPELFREKATAVRRYGKKQAALRRGVQPETKTGVAA